MATSPFYISKVVFGSNGEAVITNGSDQSADPDGLFLCQFPSYPAVPEGSVAAGESVVVPGADLGDLDSEAGELALYTSPDWSDSGAIASYVQWGTTGHKRESVAIAGAVWPENSVVDATDASEMNASGTNVQTPDGWAV